MEQNKSNNNSIVIFGLILGISGIIMSIIIGSYIWEIKTFNNSVISVTGVATKKVMSNIVKWSTSISEKTGPAQTDYQNGINRISMETKKVLNYFNNKKIPSSDITIYPISSFPRYNYQNGNRIFLGYNITQNFLIESGNIEKITNIAIKSVIDLTNQGIMFSSQQPKYYISQKLLNSIRTKMLSEALQDAKLRAESITKPVGASVGPLRSSSMGVIQITPLYSTQISNFGFIDTTSIEKRITYPVNVTFTLK
jgi:hypothetical protein